MEQRKVKKRYQWLYSRLKIGLLLYLLVAALGAAMFIHTVEDNGSLALGAAAGWVQLVMIIFVVVCMVTERGDWNIFLRIAFVPIAYILFVVFYAHITLWLAQFHNERIYPYIDIVGSTISGILILIIAMRRSRLFVRADQTGPIENMMS